MPLTNDQQKAVDAFYDFLFSDAPIFVLAGGAGVGKTYLMNYIGSDLMHFYQKQCQLIEIDPRYTEVAFTATTNKAAEVLETAIGKAARTIHSFLSLKLEHDYQKGTTWLRRTLKNPVTDTILFIDEASMIDEELYKTILRSCDNCKIVFVGDHAQLSPVNEDLSPIYRNVDEKNFVFLSEPVRNAEVPALVQLCDQLRRTVETGEFHPIEAVPGIIDYLDGPQMQAELQKAFIDNRTDARIMCNSNHRAQMFNAALREMRELPQQFLPGEVLVAARNYYNKPNQISVERQVTVMETGHERIPYGYAPYTPDGEEIEAWLYKVSHTGEHGNTFTVAIPCDADYAKKTLKKLKQKKEWPLYFQFQTQFADLRAVDACTVYKSQGSTYDTAFIDIGNIGVSHDPDAVARMLFVAASRARKRVCLFGKLPGKYIGRRVA